MPEIKIKNTDKEYTVGKYPVQVDYTCDNPLGLLSTQQPTRWSEVGTTERGEAICDAVDYRHFTSMPERDISTPVMELAQEHLYCSIWGLNSTDPVVLHPLTFALWPAAMLQVATPAQKAQLDDVLRRNRPRLAAALAAARMVETDDRFRTMRSCPHGIMATATDLPYQNIEFLAPAGAVRLITADVRVGVAGAHIGVAGQGNGDGAADEDYWVQFMPNIKGAEDIFEWAIHEIGEYPDHHSTRVICELLLESTGPDAKDVRHYESKHPKIWE